MKRVGAVKRRRQLKSTPENDSEHERTTLLDLPDFCMDKILCPLSLKELAAVANSNTLLKERVICIFELNKLHQKLNTDGFSQTEHDAFASILSAFGAHFDEITIKSDDNEKFIDALVEHCSQSLPRLCVNFEKMSNKTIVLNRPFVNLKSLYYTFKTSTCNKLWLTQMNQWFPMMVSLNITYRKPIRQIENLLNYNIKCLKLFDLRSCTNNTCDNIDIFNFLRANPQLEMVDIRKNGTERAFEKMGLETSKIKDLTITTTAGKISLLGLMELNALRRLNISAGIGYTHMNNLKLPHLDKMFIKLIGNVNAVLKFIATCHSLSLLSIDLNEKPFNSSDIDQMLSNITFLRLAKCSSLSLHGVMNFKKLLYLNISADEYPDIQHIDLPQLRCLIIKLTENMQPIIMFIEKCRNLMGLTLKFDKNVSLSSSHIERLTAVLMDLNVLDTIECNGLTDENLAKWLQTIPRRRNGSTNVRRLPLYIEINVIHVKLFEMRQTLGF